MRKFVRMTWQIGIVLGILTFFLLWQYWGINFFLAAIAGVVVWWFGSAIIGFILSYYLRVMIQKNEQQEGRQI